MRYGIFSDIHANLHAFHAVKTAYAGEAIDRYYCVGDIVGYGAEPEEGIAEVRSLAAITVAGNHDWACADAFSLRYFNMEARIAAEWTRQRLDKEGRTFLAGLPLVYRDEVLTLVHGSLDSPGDFNYVTDVYAAQAAFASQETRVCFIGHLHVPGVFVRKKDGIFYSGRTSVSLEQGCSYIVNVGSVGQPRDGNPDAAYCIYDSGRQKIEIKRTPYDAAAACDRIIKAGLPAFLGKRLLYGN